jgi:hypothetical protein
MAPSDREAFIVGRRMGRYRLVWDYTPAPDVEMVRRDLIKRFGTVDKGILKILVNFI